MALLSPHGYRCIDCNLQQCNHSFNLFDSYRRASRDSSGHTASCRQRPIGTGVSLGILVSGARSGQWNLPTALIAWSIGALSVLLIVDIHRWRTLARSHPGNQTGLLSPIVMQLARVSTLSDRDHQAIRRIPNWLQVQADLRNVDPLHPARAIRIALGPR